MPDRFELHATGTPLQAADRLGAALGFAPGRLLVKRDDLTGVAGGGNKARKLEHLVAAALADGADTLLTTGAAQSNHVRATGSAARAAGLACVAVLTEDEPPTEAEGNLVLDELFGTTVVWARPAERDDAMAETARRLRQRGRQPYVIPVGGSSPVGMAGYVRAADELADEAPADALVLCAAGTGGTHAGLAAGFGRHDRVLGVDVGALPDLAERLPGLADAAADAAGRARPEGTPALHPGQPEAPYGRPTERTLAAIRLAADTEGLVLDPVYTGRALAGLAQALADGQVDPDRPTVFVHTGGMPALFTARYRGWWSLPTEL